MTGVAAALPLAAGAPPARWWRVLGAFVRRDAAIALSYKLPFALGMIQSLFSLGFIYFIGRLVGPRIALASTQGTYFDFAVLGTVLLTLFTTSLVAMAQQLRADQTTGTLEVLFTMPLRPALAAVGSIAYQICFAAVTGVVTLLLAVSFGLRFHVTWVSVLAALAALAASVVLFVSVGLAFAAYVLVFKRGETMTSLAVGAITLLGGVYYPVSLMPGVLRDIANVLPFTWALVVLRAALLTGAVPVARLGQVTVSAGLSVPIALALFALATRHAKRRGTLGQY